MAILIPPRQPTRPLRQHSMYSTLDKTGNYVLTEIYINEHIFLCRAPDFGAALNDSTTAAALSALAAAFQAAQNAGTAAGGHNGVSLCVYTRLCVKRCLVLTLYARERDFVRMLKAKTY